MFAKISCPDLHKIWHTYLLILILLLKVFISYLHLHDQEPFIKIWKIYWKNLWNFLILQQSLIIIQSILYKNIFYNELLLELIIFYHPSFYVYVILVKVNLFIFVNLKLILLVDYLKNVFIKHIGFTYRMFQPMIQKYVCDHSFEDYIISFLISIHFL